MDKKAIFGIFVVVLFTMMETWQAGACTGDLAEQTGRKVCVEKVQAEAVESVLERLNHSTQKLKSYQCQIEYEVRQPLFESRSLRKGVLYYQRCGEKSKLRINFNTLKQDDEKEKRYIEEYIFDGIWLTHIDHQLKQVKKRQLAEPNDPAEAFDLVSQDFPIIGFTKVEDLRKEFEIELVEQKQGKASTTTQLHLKVKPGSLYKDDYTAINFWIDKKLSLPAKIVARSTEEDIYEMKLVKPRINEKLAKKVFTIKIGKGFGEPEIIPLRKKGHRNR